MGLTYLVPLRRWEARRLGDLGAYLRDLASGPDPDLEVDPEVEVEVVVVDGSAPDVFDAHRRELPPPIRHVAVDPGRRGRSGKVDGVMTGIALASHERVVLADDDVRYDLPALRRIAGLLATADVVRPQNHFRPLPWHAAWDTARTLVNRSVGSDFPGTLAVRRSTLVATGGYDAACLFENLELIRTVRAAGGVVLDAPDLFVRRLPPSPSQFRRQRVRQAFDSGAQPARMVAELAVIPLIVWSGFHRRARWVAGPVLAAAAVALAEVGRRRHGGRRVFRPSAALWAPAWLLERGVCAWVALALRLRGGVWYAGARFAKAANPPRVLRRRLAGSPGLPVATIGEHPGGSGLTAEGRRAGPAPGPVGSVGAACRAEPASAAVRGHSGC